jgi:hypothetical protein
MQEQDNNRPKVTPLRKAIGRFFLFGMMVPGVILMIIGRRRHGESDWLILGVSSGTLFLIGLMLFASAILILLLMAKIAPVGPPPDRQAIQREADRMRPTWEARQRWRYHTLAVLVPALIISWPVLVVLRNMQSSTPALAGMPDAGLQRIAIVAGIVIALVGYGMFRLVRRGDSGSG